MKGTDRQVAAEVTAPAREEITKSQERLSRINRILFEAAQAEIVVTRRKGT
jgi:hypothetical protein